MEPLCHVHTAEPDQNLFLARQLIIDNEAHQGDLLLHPGSPFEMEYYPLSISLRDLRDDVRPDQLMVLFVVAHYEGCVLQACHDFPDGPDVILAYLAYLKRMRPDFLAQLDIFSKMTP